MLAAVHDAIKLSPPRTDIHDRIAAIKRGLLSEHKAAWGDILVPNGLPSNTNRTATAAFNLTAAGEAMQRSDEIAWQWGFWPFTKIAD